MGACPLTQFEEPPTDIPFPRALSWNEELAKCWLFDGWLTYREYFGKDNPWAWTYHNQTIRSVLLSMIYIVPQL